MYGEAMNTHTAATATARNSYRYDYRAEVLGINGQFFTVRLRGFGPLRGREVVVHWQRMSPYLTSNVRGEAETLYSASIREDDVEEFLD